MRQKATGLVKRWPLPTWGGAAACVGFACVALACTVSSSASYPSLIRGTSTPDAAWAATRSEDWDAAAARWQSLFLASEGRDPVACRETARAMAAAGDPEGALEVLSIGLEAAPDDPDLLESRGLVWADMGYRRAAEGSLEDALFADPNRVSALRSLGRVRLSLNRSTAAMEPLERCIELGATDTETRLLLCRAQVCAGFTDEAFEGFVLACAADDVTAGDLVDATALMLEARGLECGTLEGWLERALELNPNNAQAHYYLGVVHSASKDYSVALKCWRRTVALDPGHVGALEGIAECHRRRGKHEQAARFKRRAEQAAKSPYR